MQQKENEWNKIIYLPDFIKSHDTEQFQCDFE